MRNIWSLQELGQKAAWQCFFLSGGRCYLRLILFYLVNTLYILQHCINYWIMNDLNKRGEAHIFLKNICLIKHINEISTVRTSWKRSPSLFVTNLTSPVITWKNFLNRVLELSDFKKNPIWPAQRWRGNGMPWEFFFFSQKEGRRGAFWCQRQGSNLDRRLVGLKFLSWSVHHQSFLWNLAQFPVEQLLLMFLIPTLLYIFFDCRNLFFLLGNTSRAE